MKGRHILNNYSHPPFYYERLLFFFMGISALLALTLQRISLQGFEFFVLQFFIIFFMLLTFAAAIEFFSRGEYMNPLEMYDILRFSERFVHSLKDIEFPYEDYFHPYDTKSKKLFEKKLKKKVSQFFVSTVRKKDEKTYIVTLIDKKNFYIFFLFRFLAKRGIIKLTVHKAKENSFRVIGIK